MNLTRLAIRNSQFVVIVLLIAILLGVRSFNEMPRSEDPQVDFPIYVITIIYPGTSPEDMETLIVDPIEDALDKVEQLTKVKTIIREGVSRFEIDAEFDIDSKDKLNDILREVNQVRPDLPQGIALFDVQQIKPDERLNFCLFAVTSDVASYSDLYDIAERIKNDIEDVDGTNKVTIDAYPEEEIRVSLDYERMASQNINLGQIVTTLTSNNINIPGGEVSTGGRNFTIQSSGGYDNLEDIRNTIIDARGNMVIRLRDLATIEKTHQDILWKGEFNNTKSVYITSKLKRGYNVLMVDKNVQGVIRKYQSSLPPNITLNVAFEQASAVDARINDFFYNLLQGVILVGIVILLFLGWRAAIIIITLIPICIVLALAILNGSGYALQQISIASLILALGLLVDNGIVVIENITRFIKEGYSKKEAAIKGANEVSLAIVASTITTLLAFFPLTQLGEAVGLFLISLPLTVIYTLVISLILALTFSPIMSNWILTDKSIKPTIADKLFIWLTTKIYSPILHWGLRFGWIVIIFVIALTAFTISLFPQIGVSFFPTADKPLLLVDVDTPRGSSLEYTDKAVSYVESILDTLDIVDNYSSNVGNGSPQVYYNRIPKRFVKNHGQLVVNLKQWESKSFYQTIAHLRNKFRLYPGAKITVEELKNGAPVEAPIVVRIFGEDLNKLKIIASKVENLLKNTEDVINIQNPVRRNQTQIKVNLDKEKAGLLNVTELDFDRTIRASLNGLRIDKVALNDQEDYDLVIRMPFEEKPTLSDFDKIYVSSRIGAQIPVSHISEIEIDGGPALIAHYDNDRYISITGSLGNLDNTISTTLDVIDKLDELNWPNGYSYGIGGEYEEQQKAFGNLGIILILALIGIFAVLVLQFRSILQPIIVFAAIPLALSGSFLALYFTGWSFSFFAFIGIISLIGIVVNNSIIMVDYINQLRSEGLERIQAIEAGSMRRFKPIILTTFTTILGLVPLTIQGTNQWSPLCWTIIGGMISSTLLTLLVVPILYKWLSKREIVE